jgi:hypothetical protein
MPPENSGGGAVAITYAVGDDPSVVVAADHPACRLSAWIVVDTTGAAVSLTTIRRQFLPYRGRCPLTEPGSSPDDNLIEPASHANIRESGRPPQSADDSAATVGWRQTGRRV